MLSLEKLMLRHLKLLIKLLFKRFLRLFSSAEDVLQPSFEDSAASTH